MLTIRVRFPGPTGAEGEKQLQEVAGGYSEEAAWALSQIMEAKENIGHLGTGRQVPGEGPSVSCLLVQWKWEDRSEKWAGRAGRAHSGQKHA